MPILNTYAGLTSWVGDYELVGINDNEASAADKTKNMTAAYLRGINLRQGEMFNGKISPTVSANDLILALKTTAGTDPSAANPVFVNINGTVRVITAALSVTAPDGTNWAGLGGQFATIQQNLFAYLGYNATDGVVIGWSRIPNARLYSDFSATSTNEKYCKISTITNAAAEDAYVNIGMFSATLSAGAGYTWTIPVSYDNSTLINEPTYASRTLTWTPTASGYSVGNGTLVAKYIIDRGICKFWFSLTFGNTTSVSGDFNFALPFTPSVDTSALADITDSGSAGYDAFGVSGSGVMYVRAINSAGTYPTNSTAFSATVPFTWATNDVIRCSGQFLI